MTREELIQLWSAAFKSPFPENATNFWMRYDARIVNTGFKALAKTSTTFNFKTLADACRFATAVMRTESGNELAETLPAPVLQVVNHVA